MSERRLSGGWANVNGDRMGWEDGMENCGMRVRVRATHRRRLRLANGVVQFSGKRLKSGRAIKGKGRVGGGKGYSVL